MSGIIMITDNYKMLNKRGVIPRHIVLICIFVLSSLGAAYGQGSPFLDFIGAAERDGKVFLQWVMSSGATCDGIDVYRSTDGDVFERVGRIAGVCGSPDFALGYDFTDASPVLNRINYYRLELGNLGVSEIIAIHVFDFSEKKYQIIPHPLSSESELFFDNPQLENSTLAIYNLVGNRVYIAEGKASSFPIRASELATGTYVFTVTNAAGKLLAQGKLVVLNSY